METSNFQPTYKAKSKRNVLLAIVGIEAANFITTWLYSGSMLAYQVTSLFAAVAIAVAILIWCHIDAQGRGIRLGTGFRVAVILLWPVAVCYYLFKSRGLKDGFIAVLKAIAFSLGLIIMVMVLDLCLALIDDRLGYFKNFQ